MTYYILFFIEVGTRVYWGGMTHHPDADWMEQVARNACGPQKQESSLCSLLHQAVFVVQATKHRFLRNAETGWQLVSVAARRNFVLGRFR